MPLLVILGLACGGAQASEPVSGKRVKIEAVDDRTGQLLAARVHFDCKDVGATPYEGVVPKSVRKVSVSCAKLPWQRVRLDSGSGEAGHALVHFRCSSLNVWDCPTYRSRSKECITFDSLRASARGTKEGVGRIRARVDSLKALCSDELLERVTAESVYRKIESESRPHGKDPNPKRYEDALFNLAEISFLTARQKIAEFDEFPKHYAEMDSCGLAPLEPVDPYLASRAEHHRYLDSVPEGFRRDIILARLAWMMSGQSQSDSAWRYLTEAIRLHPDSKGVAYASCRIGEREFGALRYDTAAVWLSRFLDRPESNVPLLPRIHRLRVLGLLDSCFLAKPQPLHEARKFFDRIGPRPYQDTVYNGIAERLGQP